MKKDKFPKWDFKLQQYGAARAKIERQVCCIVCRKVFRPDNLNKHFTAHKNKEIKSSVNFPDWSGLLWY